VPKQGASTDQQTCQLQVSVVIYQLGLSAPFLSIGSKKEKEMDVKGGSRSKGRGRLQPEGRTEWTVSRSPYILLVRNFPLAELQDTDLKFRNSIVILT
jgi:hypothetical protein